ncbi:Beta-glucanase [Dissostichus eleginoides]|uniref:Beta-glucanase n=1 Tax=Dissostichus eleginoides TaxID=100907 RepID=A0AAD9FKL5_DISEL|nr:Beta-glucanase [Dissostichus eleginoides]
MIHHEFGSKALINKLHMMGHCVSYDEVRQFLTSVAADQLQRSKGVYIPNGLTRTTEHGIIDAAIDNFDQNEETLDGKNTTHSMAIVVYRRGDVATAHNPIPRIPERSLHALDSCDLDNEEVQRYIKPGRRSEPPAVLPQILKSDRTKAQAAEGQDLLWKVSRIMKEEQRIPGWSAFNAYLSTSDIPLTTVQYMPFIRASPSDLSTIYTALLQLTQLAQELGQRHILVTADLAIYSKAQQIMWSKPEALDGKITMRIGGMHVTMAFLASIGKVYADGGLFDMITESGVYADATAQQMLQGKQLTRGVRSIKVVSEALFRLFWMALDSWLNKKGQSPLSAEQEHLLRDVQHAFHGNNQVSARQFLSEVETDLPDLRRKIQQFSESGVQQSATFKYWLNFLKGADLLLRMLRSEREANFDLHLNCMSEAIPWFRAAGRMNYAKYMPVYIAEMKALEKSQPDSYKFMREGGFVVRRSDERNFNCVATDQALEQTINREGKGQGGIIGFTLRKGALKRWLITRHVTSEYCDAMTELCDAAAHAPKSHKEHGAARMDRDERETIKIMEFVQDRQNPFDLEKVPDELINITSGQVASQKVAKDLSSFLEDGEKLNANFIDERLKSDRPKSFWDPEKRQKLATFTDMIACIATSKSKKLQMDSDVLFRRLLAVSKQRDVSLENVMRHELAAVPPSLFYDDGAMRKTTKADLAKKLESVVEVMQELSDTTEKSAYFIDGMAMLQSLHDSAFQTFRSTVLDPAAVSLSSGSTA